MRALSGQTRSPLKRFKQAWHGSVRLNDRGIATPVICVTGHRDIQMSVKAMKAGARDFLTKFDQDVLDAVQAAVKQSQSREAQRNGCRSFFRATRRSPQATRS